MKVYLFSYSLADLEFTQRHMEAFIGSNKYIDGWSYVFPGTYLFKSKSDFKNLWQSIHSFLGGKLFIIAEISQSSERTDGNINTAIWTWLHAKPNESLSKLLSSFGGEL